MLICLHIGAHKTATTYIQSKLMEDWDKLARARIGVVSHGVFRKQVSEALDASARFGRLGDALGRPALRRSLEKLLSVHADHDRLIMSDENVAGPIQSAIGAAGLYPQIGRRLGALTAALPSGHETRVFFCVRGYAEYFSSIFAYRAGQRLSQDVESFRERAFALKRGWVEVVSDIARVVGPERTVVWTYEAFSKRPIRIGRELLGDGPKVFVRDDKASLPSLTRKGLKLLDHVSDLLSDTESAGLARQIARMTFDPPDGKFSLFTAEEAARLTDRYARDLAAIGDIGCGLLTPESLAAERDVPAESGALAQA